MKRPFCPVCKHFDVDLERTDLFITHMHADHAGLVSALASDRAVIFCSRFDGGHIKKGVHWRDIESFGHMSGFPEREIQAAFAMHPGYKYHGRGGGEDT